MNPNQPSSLQSVDQAINDYEELTEGHAHPDTDTALEAQVSKFNDWNDEEIKAFLDQRGEDFDDCTDRSSLIQRAIHCEAMTGPVTTRPILADNDDDEIDPLDAFMADIEQHQHTKPNSSTAAAVVKKRSKTDDEEEDHMLDFINARKKGKFIGAGNSNTVVDREAAAYNSDEDVYQAARALDGPQDPTMNINNQELLLPPIDHSKITDYEAFTKDFYTANSTKDTTRDSKAVSEYRHSLGIRVSAIDAKVPDPIQSFQQLYSPKLFDTPLQQAIAKAGYTQPTAIQAQAIPAVLSGRDVLGLAKTGSGKTAAFLLPMIVHIMDQRELQPGEGPIALIIAPTRELAEQIHKECRRFARPYNLQVSAAFGGLQKHQQVQELSQGVEIAVCTPGRMIDLVKSKACSFKRTTYLVLDEADRVLHMGFEPQVRALMSQIRPDRQTLLFSATMPRRVEALASEVLHNPVRIDCGMTIGDNKTSSRSRVNQDVTQRVYILDNDDAKLQWLHSKLEEFIDDGDVLIFANQKATVDSLTVALSQGTVISPSRIGALHGDMDQYTRMQVLNNFKSGQIHVLVATDVAARGLDIKTIKTVVNYDAAKDQDTYIHRIGRTGRAGDTEGVAYTLVLPSQIRQAVDLVQCLESAGQEVPQELYAIANRDSKFNKQHRQHGGGGGGKRNGPGTNNRRGGGGGGLGFTTTASVPDGYNTSNNKEPSAVVNNNGDDARRSNNSVLHQQFRSSFVSSGTTGGELGAKPEIVMPRSSSAAVAQHHHHSQQQPGSNVLPPPPVPVAQQPIYLQRQQQQQQQQMTSSQSEVVQRAIQQAQAVAARLTAAQNQRPPPPPGS